VGEHGFAHCPAEGNVIAVTIDDNRSYFSEREGNGPSVEFFSIFAGSAQAHEYKYNIFNDL
jgi:hypothetical protein